jgi:outer membrane protein
MVRHCGKLLAGLAVPMTVGAGSITQARAQGFLELEQTPTFIGQGAGSVPDYKGWGDRSPSRREVLCA